MSDLSIIRFDPKGPGGKLDAWEEIPASALIAGQPVQRGHNYFTDPSGQLTAGVWDCTPMTTKMEPYSVNEFMLVLEGAVTIVDRNGNEETVTAGEAFIIPKGLVCSWKQTGYIRKFYVIFDDKSGTPPQSVDQLKVIKLSPNGPTGKLEPISPDPALYEGGTPVQHLFEYFDDATAQFNAGVWDCSPTTRKMRKSARNELMCILDGSVTMTDEHGNSQTFHAGDSFFVPQGLGTIWHSTEYVKKFYCIFQPKVAAVKTADAAE